jgi:outer membrane protein assembly factor BamB
VIRSERRDPATSQRPGFDAPWAAPNIHGLGFLYAFRQRDTVFLLYGIDGARARLLVAADPTTHEQRYAFDFGRFARPPRIRPGEAAFVDEQVVWAREAGGVLYVETAHSTYAQSSFGRNAYIAAISIRAGRVLWRSAALVANASTFVLAGDALVTGYGFTKEPDFLYLLDRKTGRVRDRLPVPSGPERIVRHGTRLRVRTYDHALVVELRR